MDLRCETAMNESRSDVVRCIVGIICKLLQNAILRKAIAGAETIRPSTAEGGRELRTERCKWLVRIQRLMKSRAPILQQAAS